MTCPAPFTNLVVWVWEGLEGGLFLSCLRVGCVQTEAKKSAQETRESGCSVKLKEVRLVMIYCICEEKDKVYVCGSNMRQAFILLLVKG